jgi:predicted Zn-dependent protease with MMP-like domain
MRRHRFLRLVQEALDGLPPPFRDRVANVDVVVKRRPGAADLRTAGLSPGESLYGLYEGVPLTERGGDYGMVLPDRITIFQDPLERDFSDDRELVEEVRTTVLHELAHYFGISDEALEAYGLD